MCQEERTHSPSRNYNVGHYFYFWVGKMLREQMHHIAHNYWTKIVEKTENVYLEIQHPILYSLSKFNNAKLACLTRNPMRCLC